MHDFINLKSFEQSGFDIFAVVNSVANNIVANNINTGYTLLVRFLILL